MPSSRASVRLPLGKPSSRTNKVGLLAPCSVGLLFVCAVGHITCMSCKASESGYAYIWISPWMPQAQSRRRSHGTHILRATRDEYVRPWAVLGLSPGASKEEIKARYKQLVASEHPDKWPGDDAAASRFADITVAYKALTNDADSSSEAFESVSTVRENFSPKKAVADFAKGLGIAEGDSSLVLQGVIFLNNMLGLFVIGSMFILAGEIIGVDLKSPSQIIQGIDVNEDMM
mmetsp:Transcript_12456/g.35433  ORF Transcript_12456/g.35433 Transcript_12456/m.35433 type:complete len:231 (+) Transcript_12456:48-740(+)